MPLSEDVVVLVFKGTAPWFWHLTNARSKSESQDLTKPICDLTDPSFEGTNIFTWLPDPEITCSLVTM